MSGLDETVASKCMRMLPRPRERALYARYYTEACRKLLAEERNRWQLSEWNYDTTYEDQHGRPGFVPAAEREMRAGAGALAHPVYEEPALSLWYCRQRSGEILDLPLRRVSPAHNPMAPFRRTSMFTNPAHLSLHESPEQVQQVQQVQRVRQARAAPVSLEYRLPEDQLVRYPMADVFTEVGKKYWCDR